MRNRTFFLAVLAFVLLSFVAEASAQTTPDDCSPTDVITEVTIALAMDIDRVQAYVDDFDAGNADEVIAYYREVSLMRQSYTLMDDLSPCERAMVDIALAYFSDVEDAMAYAMMAHIKPRNLDDYVDYFTEAVVGISSHRRLFVAFLE